MDARFFLLVAALVVGTVHVAMAVEDDGTKSVCQLWTEWKSENTKNYETVAEETRRFEIFQATKKQVDEHNEKFKKGEVSYKLGLTNFADLTHEEFKQRHTGGIRMKN